MLGCARLPQARTTSVNRRTISLRWSSLKNPNRSRISLSATSRLSATWRARYTVPIPPEPIDASFS